MSASLLPRAIAVTLAGLVLSACTVREDDARASSGIEGASDVLHVADHALPRVDAPRQGLAEQHALLEQRVRALEAQVAALSTSPPPPHHRPEAKRSEQAGADMREADAERLSALDASFRQEGPQGSVAMTKTAVLRQSLSQVVMNGVRSIECKRATCRLDVADGSIALQQLMSDLAERAGTAFDGAHIAHRADGSAVVFLRY